MEGHALQYIPTAKFPEVLLLSLLLLLLLLLFVLQMCSMPIGS